MAKGKKKTFDTSEAPVGPEIGSPFDDTRLFGGWEDGKVFDYDDWSARDFEEMLDRDGKAQTLERVLTLPIRSARTDIQPQKGDSGEAEWLNTFLETPANAGGMSVAWGTVIGQATSAFVLRKAFFEKVFAVGKGNFEGKIVFDKIAWRPPTTCQLARDSQTGSFAGFRQRPYWPDPTRAKSDNLGWIDYDPNRSWVYIHGTDRNPMRGTSELEVTLWCYRTKQKLRYLWYSFLEGQAIPKAIVRDKDFNNAKNVAKRVAQLKNAGVIAVEGITTIDPFESSGQGAGQFSDAIRFLDGEMSGSVLAGFTDLTSNAASGTGSYALSKDATDFFLQSRKGVADELADSITNHLLADLITYNFGPNAVAPKFVFTDLTEPSMDETFALLSTVAQSGRIPLPSEFTEELALRVGEYMDLDIDKLRTAFQRDAALAEQQAKYQASMAGAAPPQAQATGQVAGMDAQTSKAVKIVDGTKKGAKLSEMDDGRTVIDMGKKKNHKKARKAGDLR